MKLVNLNADELNEIRAIIQDWREKRLREDLRDIEKQKEEEQDEYFKSLRKSEKQHSTKPKRS